MPTFLAYGIDEEEDGNKLLSHGEKLQPDSNGPVGNIM